MPVPNHNESCETFIYPIKCQFCGESIYLFTCTCGSRVFFDIPEPPWHPHERRCFQYLMWYLNEIEGVPVENIRSIIENYAFEINCPIPEKAKEYLWSLERGRQSNKLKIINVVPGEENLKVLGIVTNINLDVNFIKRMRLTDNSFGRGLIRNLLSESYVEIMLRSETGEHTIVKEYCVFIPTKMMIQNHVYRETRLLLNIRPYHVVGRNSIWVSDDIEMVF